MGIDRFIRFRKSPPLARVRTVLEDYLGRAAVSITTTGPFLFAELRGRPSYPFKRVPGYAKYREAAEQRLERGVEVYWTKTSLDVITRQTDEYTNVVAEGFAALAARFWKGKRDPE